MLSKAWFEGVCHVEIRTEKRFNFAGGPRSTAVKDKINTHNNNIEF